jgi:hypothetical protein
MENVAAPLHNADVLFITAAARPSCIREINLLLLLLDARRKFSLGLVEHENNGLLLVLARLFY